MRTRLALRGRVKIERFERGAERCLELHGYLGTGTLFLYAKTKGELLLLVQNSMYADALERGRADAATADGVLEGVLAVVRESSSATGNRSTTPTSARSCSVILRSPIIVTPCSSPARLRSSSPRR